MNRLYGKLSLLLVSAIFALTLAFPPGSVAQDNHTAKLIEGAKKETSLIWYTSTSIEDIKRLFDAFTKKYPFIKTEFFNAGSARVFNRILNEARAGKVFFDLVAVRGVETHQLVKAGFLQPYVSPEASAYPQGFKDTKGYWVDYFDAYNVIGYNTKLVPKDLAPKSWDDLLDSQWKGKIAMDEEMYSWYAAMAVALGKRKGPAFHESSGEAGYPTPHWSVSDCATDGRGRVSHGNSIGPQNRKNEGTGSSGRMGHHPGSRDGIPAPDRGRRKGPAQQRGKVIHRAGDFRTGRRTCLS